jgi:PAS domain S-box-containing protein
MHHPTPRRNEVLFIALDGQGRVVQFAPSVERASGFLAADMLDADPFERLFAEEGAGVRQALLSSTNDEAIEVHADLRARTGERRPVYWSCWRQMPAADPVRYFIVGIDDANERKLDEQSLQNARSAAAGVLAAGLAHEIRNPLNGASLHLSVLERDLARLRRAIPSSVHEAVAVVQSELRRLSSLVTDFLEVTHPRPLTRAHVDAREVVRGAVAHVEEDAKKRRVALAADLPAHPLVAWLDNERLKQTVINLIQNALEAVVQEGTVVVRVRASGAHLELEVEDDGPGISNAGAAVFDPFFTTKGTGTGLGLSIVRRTVADHGGDVTYTSVPRRTVFRIKLPITQDST